MSDIRINTGKGEISLDELGTIQPGMARLMAEIAPRVSNCWHAAQAGNWPLARYFLAEGVKVMQATTITRPKYTENMQQFIVDECDAVLSAIEAKDVDQFNEAYNAMVSAANAYHEVYDKPFIRFRTSPEPPSDLDLTPR